MYARGILFGKMVLELGDTCLAKNEKNKMFCDLEFKTKVCVIFFALNYHLNDNRGFSRARTMPLLVIYDGIRMRLGKCRVNGAVFSI
jgi:hypothetical protein